MIKEREEAVTGKYPTEFTEEVARALAAPVPANEIQSKVVGGTTISFTSDKFVHRRLDSVVGPAGWQVDYTITSSAPVEARSGLFLGQIVCRLKVLGVMKSAAADLELTKGMYGTPTTNAQARALKRAAMLFGIASELWDKDAVASDAEPAEEKVSQFKRPTRSGGGAGGPSPKQVELLGNLHVPQSLISKLTAGRDGTASQLITALLESKRSIDDYDDDYLPYIEKALKKVDRKLIPLLNEEDEDEEDED